MPRASALTVGCREAGWRAGGRAAGGRRGGRGGPAGRGGRALGGAAAGGALGLGRQVDRGRHLCRDRGERWRLEVHAVDGHQPALDLDVVVGHPHEALHAVEEVGQVEVAALEGEVQRDACPGRRRASRRRRRSRGPRCAGRAVVCPRPRWVAVVGGHPRRRWPSRPTGRRGLAFSPPALHRRRLEPEAGRRRGGRRRGAVADGDAVEVDAGALGRGVELHEQAGHVQRAGDGLAQADDRLVVLGVVACGSAGGAGLVTAASSRVPLRLGQLLVQLGHLGPLGAEDQEPVGDQEHHRAPAPSRSSCRGRQAHAPPPSREGALGRLALAGRRRPAEGDGRVELVVACRTRSEPPAGGCARPRPRRSRRRCRTARWSR